MENETNMTPAQEMEVKRMSPTMWSILVSAEKAGGIEIGGPHTRSARFLERRHFVEMRKKRNGWHTVKLTDAGREAVTRHTRPSLEQKNRRRFASRAVHFPVPR
jgi:hypothetical protein